MAQLDAPSDWRPGGRGFSPRRGRQHSFVEIDHEIFSTVILSLPLIQEGQLSVSGERMCTILVNRLLFTVANSNSLHCLPFSQHFKTNGKVFKWICSELGFHNII